MARGCALRWHDPCYSVVVRKRLSGRGRFVQERCRTCFGEGRAHPATGIPVAGCSACAGYPITDSARVRMVTVTSREAA
jgi:hypothetical protein